MAGHIGLQGPEGLSQRQGEGVRWTQSWLFVIKGTPIQASPVPPEYRCPGLFGSFWARVFKKKVPRDRLISVQLSSSSPSPSTLGSFNLPCPQQTLVPSPLPRMPWLIPSPPCCLLVPSVQPWPSGAQHGALCDPRWDPSHMTTECAVCPVGTGPVACLLLSALGPRPGQYRIGPQCAWLLQIDAEFPVLCSQC